LSNPVGAAELLRVGRNGDIVGGDRCVGCGGCLRVKPFVWTEWIPSDCASIFTRKKLMKKTVTKSVPSYKWVVEDCCPSCR